MKLTRRRFAALTAAAIAWPAAARAQEGADPALQSSSAALRVLLGKGSASSGPGGTTIFNGRQYRGGFQRLSDGSIVNVLGLEEYLASVVPREMPPSWPAAALQAQAICARSYVLARSNPRRAYDLVPSEADQVYAGMASESPAGTAAVAATAGQVLRFGAGFATTPYSSCCGGHTEASADAWGGTFVPYLGGVVCSSCSDSPNYRWSALLPLDAVELHFPAQLAPIGALRDVRVAGTDPSGRARAFELVAERGSVTVKGNAFRLGVGARALRSLLVTNLRAGDPKGLPSVLIEGGGLGHGVGMCQWGARGMALAGHTARDILLLYFPGTEIGND